jgi:hypothetical protein
MLLFLPVPLVLWLFTQAPLGVLPSLLLGTAIMGTHRLYARPWALARASVRCVWCGRGGAAPRVAALRVAEPFGETAWIACSDDHARALAGLLNWANAHARFLKIGILGTLLLFLLAGFATGAGHPIGSATFADWSAAFRLSIALTVLPLGWLGARKPADPGAGLGSPFPLHIQALIGSSAVLWLFRLVGLAWLAVGLRHFVMR